MAYASAIFYCVTRLHMRVLAPIIASKRYASFASYFLFCLRAYLRLRLLVTMATS